MSDFISLAEILENQQSFTPIKDELFAMKYDVKSYMDKGLSQEDMLVAKELQEAIFVAESILDKLAN